MQMRTHAHSHTQYLISAVLLWSYLRDREGVYLQWLAQECNPQPQVRTPSKEKCWRWMNTGNTAEMTLLQAIDQVPLISSSLCCLGEVQLVRSRYESTPCCHMVGSQHCIGSSLPYQIRTQYTSFWPLAGKIGLWYLKGGAVDDKF